MSPPKKDDPIESAAEVKEQLLRILRNCTAEQPEGFAYWCKHFVKVPDKRLGKMVPFEMFDFQKDIAKRLFDNEWICALKARQLGFTTLLTAYVVYCVTFNKMFTCSVMNQNREYAVGFVSKVMDIYRRLPKWMRVGVEKESERRVIFSNGSELHSFAANEKSGRSLTGNLIMFDEAPLMEYLKQAKQAVEPSVEQSGGQIVLVGTSNGPAGEFYETFIREHDGYSSVFYPWWARPGRTQEWYDKTAEQNKHNPLFMKQEYPATPDEAWESASGRVFPMFDRSLHVIDTGELLRQFGCRSILPDWARYRSIDWGGSDPFVCLFAVCIPGEQGFSIDPSCTETIREIAGYMRKEVKKLGDVAEAQKHDDHSCDALRYMLMRYKDERRYNGHIHIYKEVYIHTPAERGITIDHQADEVIECSVDNGIPVEFEFTVADRNRPDNIRHFQSRLQATVLKARVVRGSGQKPEREQGFDRINLFMSKRNRLHELARDTESAILMQRADQEYGATLKMQDRLKREIERLKNKKQDRVYHDQLGEFF